MRFKLTLLAACAWTSACCSGCTLVQNRYSVFGFDSYLTDSVDKAKTYSLLLLGSTALISTAIGVAGTLLCQRLRSKWREAAGERRAASSLSNQAFSKSDENLTLAGRQLEECRTT